MTLRQEIAKKLHNREYREETTPEIERLAKVNNIVIVFGTSDDYIVFRGAIHDRGYCFEGRKIYFNTGGIVRNECKDDYCPHFKKELESASLIKAIWEPKDLGCSWIYETDIPHETFDILEESEKYCQGIVFSLDDIRHESKKYIVQWDELFLVDGDSPESRSYCPDNAQIFRSRKAAEARVEEIRKFRKINNYRIIPVDV